MMCSVRCCVVHCERVEEWRDKEVDVVLALEADVLVEQQLANDIRHKRYGKVDLAI